MKTTIMVVALSLTVISAMAQGLKSGINKDHMDLTVKPGTDFYEFTGGGWMKSHPLTPEYSSYGYFRVLYDNNEKRIHEMIQSFASTPQAKGTLGQKIGSLYNLYMDSVRRNKEGYEPIKPYLKRISDIKTRKEYQLVVAELMRKSVAGTMFNVYPSADLHNAGMNLVNISQGGLGMGERDYYLNNDTATVKIREGYKVYLKKLFQLVGDDEATADKKMQAVLAIETRIAKPSYSPEQQRDVEGNYHKMTYGQLIADYPGVDWGNTLLLSGYPAVAEVSVCQPEPIHEVEKILTDTSLDDLKAYTEADLLRNTAGQLDDQFHDAAFAFDRLLSGAQQDRPRWKRGVSFVNSVLEMEVGRMYAEKYFPESLKKRMLELVHNLQTALGQRIDQLKWMGPETKKQAHDKLANFIIKIGYPDKWRDVSALQVDDTLSFFANCVKINEFFNDYNIHRKVNKPVDKMEWQMSPQTINAYYDPSTNEICFPAGILQPPFFNPEADDAWNYGAIGVVIGHEMSHGFDDQGSQFDKTGNVHNWWTATDKKNFEARTKVLADYFSMLNALPDLKVNGKLTLGENIGDNGGINIAHQAFLNSMKQNPLPDKDGYTPEQRFFIAFGNIWAENIRPELLRMYVTTDPHSPDRWRVNGALPQIDAWYKAFNITKKDPLYLSKNKRAEIW